MFSSTFYISITLQFIKSYNVNETNILIRLLKNLFYKYTCIFYKKMSEKQRTLEQKCTNFHESITCNKLQYSEEYKDVKKLTIHSPLDDMRLSIKDHKTQIFPNVEWLSVECDIFDAKFIEQFPKLKTLDLKNVKHVKNIESISKILSLMALVLPQKFSGDVNIFPSNVSIFKTYV